MAQIVDDVSEFRADRPWGARDLAEVNGATVRLHWSDQPYIWHVNDGPEVFIGTERTSGHVFQAQW